MANIYDPGPTTQVIKVSEFVFKVVLRGKECPGVYASQEDANSGLAREVRALEACARRRHGLK